MNEFYHLIEIALLAKILHFAVKTRKENRKQMASLQERFDGVNAALDEASTEILAELAKLKSETLTPEGEASLATLEAKAKALADIVPNA